MSENTPSEDRSPRAVAYQWASRIMTICFGMVVPGLVGYWIDGRLGTTPLLTIIGFLFGMFAGMWQLLRITSKNKTD